MPVDDEIFSPSYAVARERFLAAARDAGARLDSQPEPAAGREGEALALDCARLGEEDAPAVLLLSSGCHGVEGYCGSGLQLALLRDAPWLAQARAAGVALVFLHALNPWGFSHGRRVTREGVDLNRNTMDFGRPLPRNAGYDALAQALLPATWPPSPADERAITAYAQAHGRAALQAAISAGQYAWPEGLFYGGTAPTWAAQALRRALARHATRCTRLGWIDIHSGLGERGRAEAIFSCRDEASALHRAKAWWGPHVSSTYDGSSTSSDLTGNIWEAVYEECPQACYTGIGLEFGTEPPEVVLAALRLDHWVARAGDRAAPALRDQARARMREAFFIDTPDWKAAVLAQGRAAARQAVRGLAGHD